ncbi:serine hydrolase [Bradyrhizobium sp. CSA112]|uniref:serine hydrolase n=1 Tax=Bradyrhizobium sp. CSA112 TaxID=2699170 RepID=UPI0023B129F2|nr:serine hydrolase [Bradyrhizobium sp. CSA112]MDE5452388.1 serine hydrolase [Bradyrhizobium sp. CSA112]
MRNIALALVMAAGTALAAPIPSLARDAVVSSPASRAGFDTAKLKAVVTWLKADVDKGRIPGAVVLIARDGQVVLHEAVGWADKDKNIPMQRNSIHPIASSTKLITTVAALRLFEQNRLSVMAPIAAYLPELKDLKVSVEKKDAGGNVTTELVAPARQPTVHDLMTHRAGFTYFFFPPNPLRTKYKELGIDRVDNMTADEMLQKLATLPLAFPPGSSFEYSIATDLLGHIVERITKKPLDAALKELVLDPLKMDETTFFVQGSAVTRYARPLPTDPDKWVFDWLDVTRAPKRLSGGAGMASTTGDYFRLLQLLANGGTLDGTHLLSPMTVRWALADQIGTMRGVAHPGDGFLEPGQSRQGKRRRRSLPGKRWRPVLGRHHRAALLHRSQGKSGRPCLRTRPLGPRRLSCRTAIAGLRRDDIEQEREVDVDFCLALAIASLVIPGRALARARNPLIRSLMAYYVYLLASDKYGTLYLGVTNDIVRRVYEHKSKAVPGFTKRYAVDKLVWFEIYDDPVTAITREKELKKWRRDWKIRLIEERNPQWIDLYPQISV